MKNLIQRFIREEEGQDLIEYAFLVVFIAILAITILKNTSAAINGVFQKIIDTVGAV
jgi:Flp pilus assembly pilin Flp